MPPKFLTALILLASVGALGQQNPPPQTQNPPPSQNGQVNPSQLPSQTTKEKKVKTTLDKARNEVAATRSQQDQPKQFTIGTIHLDPASVGDTVTFKTKVYDRTPPNAGYTYALQGQPYGAYIDPNTGDFTWIASTPGMYTFYVWAEDNDDNTRQANQQVSITVNAPLEIFGYDVFAKARAVIETRMLLIKSGLLIGLGSVANSQNSTSTISVPLANGNPSNTSGSFGPSQNPVNQLINPSQPFFPSSSYFPQQQQQPTYLPPISPFGPNTNPFQTGTGRSPIQGPPNQGPNQGFGQPGQGPTPTTGGSYPPNATTMQNNGAQIATGQGQNGQQGPPGTTPVNPFQSPFNQVQGQGNQVPGPGAMPNGYGFGQQYSPYGQGYQIPGLPSGSQPFSSMGGSGLNIQPSSVFSNPQNLIFTSPGTNGIPASLNPQIIDALRSVVGPSDMLGMNVYVPYPERYQLGPGDLLTARIWSPNIEAQDYDLKVDPQGFIYISTYNKRLSVRGKTLADAQKLLKLAVRSLLKGGDATLTLKELRTMSIQVMGEAFQPGNYQVPAVATLFNTLVVCGGPNDHGSLRAIELRRNDGTKKTFDLYRYLTTGDTSADVPLQPGDTIWIPPAKNRISVKGEVVHPAVFETVPSDTLKDVVGFAGGAKATGVTQRVELDTEDPGIGRTVRDVDLTAGANSAHLFDGDTATVYSVRTDFLNDLKLEGAVDQPGTYEFRKGMTVSDLITKGRGLRKDAYEVRANLYRQNADKTTNTLLVVDLQKALARDPASDLALEAHDDLKVYYLDDVKWKGDRQVKVEGAVQKPDTYDRSDGMKVQDLLLDAGGLSPDAAPAEAFLQRTNQDGTMGPLLKIDLRKLAAGDPSQNVALQDKDVLTIQSAALAVYTPEQSVAISGAVQKPGTFASASNLHISDLIQQAGGLMPNAGSVLELRHARVKDTTPPTRLGLADVLNGRPDADILLVPGDLVAIPQDSSIDMQARSVMILGHVQHPGPYTIGNTDKISDIVARSGGLRAEAFPEGTQFYRDPKLLLSDTQRDLGPRIESVLQVVAQDEYTRAVALATLQQVEYFRNAQTGSSFSLMPGATQTQSPLNIPPDIWDQHPVTPARLLSPADDLTPVGNVSVNLVSALKHRGSLDDFQVRDGDIIVIPERPSTVSVVGAVVIPSPVPYKPGERVAYYVNRAGGFVSDAAKDRILVVRAGGLVEKASLSTRVRLGDQVLVPTTVVAAKLSDKATEIDEVSKNVTSGAIVIALLRSLFR